MILIGTICYGPLGINQSFAQVRTTVLRDVNAKLDNFIPYHTDRVVSKVKSMPPVDVEGAIARHKAAGQIAPLYGVPVQTAIGKPDGETEKVGDVMIWRTAARSVGAVSLNLHLDNLVLPEGAEMYVYNKAGTMVSGPVTSMHVNKGQYATDLLEGDEIVLSVVMPEKAYEKFSMNVHTVIHGFDDKAVRERTFGQSLVCNVDVNCQQGAAWVNQRDAVALILNSDGWWCSGALINNGCQDLRSFFLTANHCLPTQNVANWVFRFNYNSPNPSPANNCRGAEPTTWLTYSGADLRADRAGNDFALLELFGSIVGQPTLAIAGWDRSGVAPSNSAMIHHPKGDVKKISFDASAPVLETNNITGLTLNTANQSFRLRLNQSGDFGVLEGGSSGSPLFDSNQRIIGQLGGGEAATCENEMDVWYGRFFNSWTGGGTNNNRLSNWLGGNGVPMTTNTIRSPFISGSGVICTGGNTFTLNHPIPGRSVTWSATPATLFASPSGSGTVTTLQAASNDINGPATLTFTMTLSGCNAVSVSIPVWVGKPGIPSTNPSGYPTIQIGLGDFRPIILTNTPGGSSNSGNWWSTGSSISLVGSSSGPSATFEGVNNGTGQFYVTTTNSCGTSNNGGGAIKVSGSCTTCLQAHPNPAKGVVTISLTSEAAIQEYNIERSDAAEAADGMILLYDQLGNVAHQERLTALRQSIDTGNLQPGIYLCEVIRAGHQYKTKIVIMP